MDEFKIDEIWLNLKILLHLISSNFFMLFITLKRFITFSSLFFVLCSHSLRVSQFLTLSFFQSIASHKLEKYHQFLFRKTIWEMFIITFFFFFLIFSSFSLSLLLLGCAKIWGQFLVKITSDFFNYHWTIFFIGLAKNTLGFLKFLSNSNLEIWLIFA